MLLNGTLLTLNSSIKNLPALSPDFTSKFNKKLQNILDSDNTLEYLVNFSRPKKFLNLDMDDLTLDSDKVSWISLISISLGILNLLFCLFIFWKLQTVSASLLLLHANRVSAQNIKTNQLIWDVNSNPSTTVQAPDFDASLSHSDVIKYVTLLALLVLLIFVMLLAYYVYRLRNNQFITSLILYNSIETCILELWSNHVGPENIRIQAEVIIDNIVLKSKLCSNSILVKWNSSLEVTN